MKFALAFLALALTGCGAATKVADLAKSAAYVVSDVNPRLVVMYEADQRRCFANGAKHEAAKECIDKVRKDWMPIRTGMQDISGAWCKFEPEKCATQDAAHKVASPVDAGSN